MKIRRKPKHANPHLYSILVFTTFFKYSFSSMNMEITKRKGKIWRISSKWMKSSMSVRHKNVSSRSTEAMEKTRFS